MALPQNLRVKGSNFPIVEAITLSTVGEASLAMKAIVLALAGMAGLAIGAAVAPFSKHVIRPLWQRLPSFGRAS